MQHSIKSQYGGGIFLVLGVIAFGVLLLLKVLPVYMEHGKVTASLDKLKQDPDILSKPEAEVLKMLQKQFDIDDVKGVTKDDITITKSSGYLSIEIGYVPEVKLFANVSLKFEFDDAMEVGSQ